MAPRQRSSSRKTKKNSVRRPPRRTGKKTAAKKPFHKTAKKKPAATRVSPAPRKPARRRPLPARPIKLGANPFDIGLDKNPANYQPLTPLQFLERAASVYPSRTAIIHGMQRVTYAEFYARSRRLASALTARGVKKGDVVAAMLSNTPPMLEAHYGVPMRERCSMRSIPGSMPLPSPSCWSMAGRRYC